MPRLRPLGVTLVELLVALALLGVLGTSIGRLIAGISRMTHTQAQWLDVRRNLRVAETVLRSELRELAASDGDVHAMGANEIRFRAFRRLAVVCEEPALGGPPLGVRVVIAQDELSGDAFEPDDSLLIFYRGDLGTPDDDGWSPGAVVAATPSPCPSGGPGQALTVGLRFETGQRNRPGAIPRGAAIRGFEAVRYAAYRGGDGLWYLGLQTPGATIQPVAGPLAGSGGLSLRYVDETGAPTGDPLRIAGVEIRVRGRTKDPLRRAGSPPVPGVDSVVSWVALRNNRKSAVRGVTGSLP